MKAHYVAKYTFIEFFIEEEIVVALYMGQWATIITIYPPAPYQFCKHTCVSHKRKARGQVARCKIKKGQQQYEKFENACIIQQQKAKNVCNPIFISQPDNLLHLNDGRHYKIACQKLHHTFGLLNLFQF